MRHASLALLGAAVQLGALGDLAAPAGEPVTASDIAADMMWRLARDTRDSLASAERVRRRYCEVKGLPFQRITPEELAEAFRPNEAMPETVPVGGVANRFAPTETRRFPGVF